jgi:putative Ig domain-containing protein
MANPPVLVELIPPQVVLEGAEFPTIHCKNYIISPDEESGPLRFFAELPNGAPIPHGLVCSADGILSGTPEMGTEGSYEIQIVAENDSGTPLETRFNLSILAKKEAKPGEPVLAKLVPNIVVNEGAALGPIDLKQYIHAFDPKKEKLFFTAELINGAPFPDGIICTSSGILSGIPASDTLGNYDVRLIAENPANGAKLETQFLLTIKERLEMGGEPQFYTGLKKQIWDALEKNQPVPEFAELFNRQLTAVEIYYLMQRFATLTIYDVYNLDRPGALKLLSLEGASPHYNIYDRGSCIVGAPKELFSHARTLEDALITAKVMAREVYKRGWTIEFVGFQKMMRAGWVELQVLGEKHGNALDILHYSPTDRDVKLIMEELKTRMDMGKIP